MKFLIDNLDGETIEFDFIYADFGSKDYDSDVIYIDTEICRLSTVRCAEGREQSEATQ